MESAAEKKKFEFPFGFGAGIFVFSLLMSLDGLVDAKRALAGNQFPGVQNPSFLRITLTEPWIFGLMLGVMLWQAARRRNLSRPIAGMAMMILGMAICIGYQVLGTFVNGR